jgi:glycosyltransferase involved in cell wall biosynthesis
VTRVLWISEEVPDRNGHGGQRRQYHLIKALIAGGIRVDVAVPPSPQDTSSISALTSVTVLDRPRRRLGFGASAFDLLVESSRPDAVIICHPVSVGLVRATFRRPRVPLYIDVHNVDSRWFTHLGDDAEVRRAVRAERRILERATAIACSEEERAALHAVDAAGDVIIVRQGFDPDEWADPGAIEIARPVLAFFGSLWYPINTDGLDWFIELVWPKIRRERPDAELQLFGAGPGERFTDPAAGIVAEGWVEDLATSLRSASMIIVPILAGPGSRVKFPEALASGVPVVATGIAGESFDADDHYLRADDPDSFARACLKVLADTDDARRMATSAREYAMASLTWDAAARPLIARLHRTDPIRPS